MPSEGEAHERRASPAWSSHAGLRSGGGRGAAVRYKATDSDVCRDHAWKLIASQVIAQPVSEEGHMGFAGRTFHYRYESGLEVTGTFTSPTQLTWEALTGPAKGMRGTESIHALEVAPNVFFISSSAAG